ncbi:hypothetical protein [uncultured Kordia sp.]|uniref:hypothetical protein n=1 Tax=uncultured Kordia sp. TaxID=507699 RepID=UPI002609DB86|nr:hypothetical protein [uncultured Kordia sp.]
MKKIILGASAFLFAAALMLTTNTQKEITVNEALAAGTCCPGTGICYPGNGTHVNVHWWRSDGKPCDAKIKEVEEFTSL